MPGVRKLRLEKTIGLGKSTHLMAAKYIFVVLGTGFLVAGVSERLRGRGNPASRTWLILGTIFTLVSLFLFAQS